MLNVDESADGRCVLRVTPEHVCDFLDLTMRVTEDCRQTTVFIGIEPNGTFIPLGTGFLVAIRGKLGFMHFVATAAHVLDQVKADKVIIRLNGKDGQVHSAPIPKAWSIRSDDEAQDLVLLGYPVDPSPFEHKVITLDRAEWENEKKIWEPGIGDEVAIVGLYSSHFGLIKSVPVVRVGHIAMMPGEPVRTNKGYVAAYLVEVKSIAGLSGSPVFRNTPQFRVTDDGKVQHLRKPVLTEIGMVLGYHVVESAQDQITVPQFQGDAVADGLSVDERNTGFTVVLPFEAILDLVESERFQEMVKTSEREHLARSGYRDAGISVKGASPAADAAEKSDPKQPNPEHKEAFSSLVGAAAKTKKPAE
jgi:hypothetical protein